MGCDRMQSEPAGMADKTAAGLLRVLEGDFAAKSADRSWLVSIAGWMA